MPNNHSSLRARYFILAGVIVLVDQASKWLVGQWLVLSETRILIPGLFNLTHVRNRGAAFGLFSDTSSPVVSFFLIGFSLLALALLLTLLGRGAFSLWTGTALGLILGGATGNLLDRLRTGSVVDFLDFHLGVYHWPAFNLADSAIVAGAAILLGELLLSRHEVPGEV